MPATRETDPLLIFNFGLELGGTLSGYFTEVSGIGSETEVVEHKVVDKDGRDVVLKVPGRLKWTEVTLKRGITKVMDVWEWRDKVVNGDTEGARKNGSIIMFDRSNKPVARWDFVRGWPSKVTGPSFKSDSNEFGIEEMVLVHEGIKRTK